MTYDNEPETGFSNEDFDQYDRILRDLLFKSDNDRSLNGIHRLSEDHHLICTDEELDLNHELLAIGDFLGTYEIKRYVGHGGYGIVYQALCRETNQTVAIKVPRRDKATNIDVRKRFEREAFLTRMINHPMLVKVISSGEMNGLYFIVYEYIEGLNLKNWLKRNNELSLETILRLGLEILDVLNKGFLMGVVNRDLKPSNILVYQKTNDRKTNELTFRITDLGLSHNLLNQSLSISRSTMIVGTLQYMAPEQALSGTTQVDIRADLYSLGLILIELIHKTEVRNIKSLSELILYFSRDTVDHEASIIKSEVSRNLYAVLRKSTRLDPTDRYQTPREFSMDLKAVLSKEPVTARIPSSFEILFFQLRRKPERMISLVVITIITAIMSYNIISSNSYLKTLNKKIINQNKSLTIAKQDIEMMNESLKEKQSVLENAKKQSDIRMLLSEFNHSDVDMTHEILDNFEDKDNFIANLIETISSIEFRSYKLIDFSKYAPVYELGGDSDSFFDQYNEILKSIDNHSLRIIFNRSNIYLYTDTTLFQVTSSGFKESELIYHEDLELLRVEMSNQLDLILGLRLIQHTTLKYELVIYNRITNEIVRTGVEITDPINDSKLDYALSPDSTFFVYFEPDNQVIHKVSTANGEVIESIQCDKIGIESDVISIAIGTDEDELLLGLSSGMIAIVSKSHEWTIQHQYASHFNVIHQVGFLDNNRFFVRIRYSDKIYIFSRRESDKPVKFFDHEDEVWSITFMSDPDYFVSTGDDHFIKLWNRKTQEMKVVGSMNSLVTRSELSSSGKLLATGDYDGNLYIYETENWEVSKKYRLTDSKIEGISWLGSDDSLAIVHRDGSLSVLDLKINNYRQTRFQGSCSDVLFDKEKDLLIISNQYKGNGIINFFSTHDFLLKKQLFLHSTPKTLFLNKKSNVLYVGNNESGISLINYITLEILPRFIPNLNLGPVEEILLSSDEEYLISAVENKQIMIYDKENLSYLGNILGHSDKIKSMAFDPVSMTLATGDMKGLIRLISFDNHNP